MEVSYLYYPHDLKFLVFMTNDTSVEGRKYDLSVQAQPKKAKRTTLSTSYCKKA